MKKILSFALVLVLMMSLCAVSYAAPVKASDEAAAEQLKLIAASFDSCRQDESAGSWSYTVTDLNHNGRLELFAATIDDMGRHTFVKLWEVSEDLSALNECSVILPEDESFPDVLTENADTYYNPQDDSWAYQFYDNIVLSGEEAYYARCTVQLQDGKIGFKQLAVSHTVVTNGVPTTTYMDNSGNVISGEQYNNAGNPGDVELVRSSTNFDWVLAADVTEARLTDAYGVFKGIKELPEKMAQTTAPEPQPMPEPTNFLTITKSPTNESRVTGETAWFVSGASGWTSLAWTFVSPSGGEFSLQNFKNTFPTCTVDGADSTTLKVNNLSLDMSGWGVFCTFYNNGQTARTNTAYMYVSVRQAQPAQQQSTTTVTVPYYYSVPNGAVGTDGYTYYYGDGSYYTTYSTGTQEYRGTDGSVTYLNTDGTVTYLDPQGNVSEYENDGTTTTYFIDGSILTQFNDGTLAVDNGNGTGEYIENGTVYTYGIPEVYSNYYGWGYYNY